MDRNIPRPFPLAGVYEKTDTMIRFHTTDSASSLRIMFDTAGTTYGAGAGSGYQSAEELYEDTWNYGSVSSVLEPTSM